MGISVGLQLEHRNSAVEAPAAAVQLVVVAVAALVEDRRPAAADMALDNPVQHNKQPDSVAAVEEEPNLYDETAALVGPVGAGDNLQKTHRPLLPHPQGQIPGTLHLNLTQQEKQYSDGQQKNGH